MVRVKATGETTEVDCEVMKTLRNEEKKLRRSYDTGGSSASGDEEETQPSTILSLDAVPEDDVKSSAWLADPNDGIKDAELRMLEAEFMETLTSVQLNIYKACITSGQTPTDYARAAQDLPTGSERSAERLNCRVVRLFAMMEKLGIMILPFPDCRGRLGAFLGGVRVP